ncbi:aminotransferase [Nitzschia inconspicua]|uniref:Branched-chain-amino-acid aminotransferase n=1 Tax=Nitzschia inconspicua TaxID=303405 RepID=A0A9K3L9A0_9STRA|nr:aminotransferase [Nitzschia inconspicua]
MTSTISDAKDPKDGIDFESLPWNLNHPEEHCYVHLTTTSDGWTKEHYDPETDSGQLFDSVHKYNATPLPVFPSMTSLNYGTTIWEGLKCYRNEDGKPIVFRPDRNFERFANGAAQMCLPVPSRELFLRGIQHVLQQNSHIIPPHGEGMKLYVRPMLLGSGQQLGLYPSPQFSLLFFVSPTGNYFKTATGGLQLHLETRRSRAARGGVGNVKCSGNYAVALKPLMDAKKQGFHDNLFLELETYHKDGNLESAILQEMSAANVFLVLRTGEIVTPSLERGTILPGVTRDSVITIVNEFAEELKVAMKESTGQDSNVTVSSRDITVAELKNATEAFCTGTAAEVAPIARLATGEGEDPFEVVFEHGHSLPGGPVTSAILKMLREVMVGDRSSNGTKDWLRDPFGSPDEFCKA